MHMVHKLVRKENGLDPGTWFEKAADSGRATRITADPLNIKPRAGRLEVRRSFLTVRVFDDWNRISSDIMRKPTATSFKAAHARIQEGTTYSAAVTGRRTR
jgi:hypothetical protein